MAYEVTSFYFDNPPSNSEVGADGWRVLMILAERVFFPEGDEGDRVLSVWAQPSIHYIAQRAGGVSDRAVQSTIKKLEKAGEVIVLGGGGRPSKKEKVSGKRWKHTNAYVLVRWAEHVGADLGDLPGFAAGQMKREADRLEGLKGKKGEADFTLSAEKKGEADFTLSESKRVKRTSPFPSENDKRVKSASGMYTSTIKDPSFSNEKEGGNSPEGSPFPKPSSPLQGKGGGEKSKPTIRNKPKRQKKGSLTQEEKDRRDKVFFAWTDHLVKRWGYDLDSALYGRERASAWNLARRGYSPEEVVEAYEALRIQFGGDRHLSLNGIVGHIGSYFAQGNGGSLGIEPERKSVQVSDRDMAIIEQRFREMGIGD